MADFDIFCDSGANIPLNIVKRENIKVIPYTLTINGEERCCYNYETDFSVIAKKFYDEVRAGAEAKTSLIGSERIAEAFTPSLKAGKDVLAVFISSGISGTYNQACEAKKQLEALYPERRVYVCDGANASMGMGLQVLQAAKLKAMGESAAACAEWIENNKYKYNSFLTVGDLKYLKKSGRISATLAIAGTILNIKPVLTADGGDNAKIVSFSKERGRKKALAALAECFEKNVVDVSNQTVAICHADSPEDAETLAGMLRERGAKDIIIEYYDLCTGTHVGPGTVALFFYGKDRKSGVKPKAGILSKFKKKAKQKN